MKFQSSYALVGAVAAPLVSAFPAGMMEAVARDPELQAKAIEMTQMLAKRQAGADAATAVFEPIPTFDEASQFIDVGPGSGHEYKAPGEDDLRGVCPGLNAFANHGFLPRSGFASIQQFIDVTQNVVGMGPQLAGFLATYGAIIDGSGTGWSIGGVPSTAQSGALPGAGGNGLTGSHNKYESDASPTRPDLYQEGNNYKTQADQFQEMLDYNPGGEVTLDGLTAFRSKRFDEQIAANPYFFNGPFTGVLVQPAAYTFISRFMSNHSEANPTGILTYDVIKSWFAITGTDGNYKANQGQERIPLNWYRRPMEYPYELEYFLADVAAAAALHPKFIDIGGNTGTTNSFTGVDIEDLSGGLFNGATLFNGNNFGCFLYQSVANAKPDFALGGLNTLMQFLTAASTKLQCPKLAAFDYKVLQKYPGYKRSPANA